MGSLAGSLFCLDFFLAIRSGIVQKFCRHEEIVEDVRGVSTCEQPHRSGSKLPRLEVGEFPFSPEIFCRGSKAPTREKG